MIRGDTEREETQRGGKRKRRQDGRTEGKGERELEQRMKGWRLLSTAQRRCWPRASP
jgi:hypothetical protein